MANYLYDPKTNVSTEITYAKLAEISGLKVSTLQSYSARKVIIKSLQCYVINEKTTLEERRELYARQEIKGEIWKVVEGSDEQFLISNHGRVKRRYKNVKSKFMLPYLRKQNGHLYVKVRLQGRYKEVKVAHLVAHHFVGPNKLNLMLRHKNGIKTDCFAGNLQYITRQKLGALTGAMAKSKEVIQLCPIELIPINEFRSAREAGRECFMSYQSVLDNCHGKTKLAAGCKFVFAENYEY